MPFIYSAGSWCAKSTPGSLLFPSLPAVLSLYEKHKLLGKNQYSSLGFWKCVLQNYVPALGNGSGVYNYISCFFLFILKASPGSPLLFPAAAPCALWNKTGVWAALPTALSAALFPDVRLEIWKVCLWGPKSLHKCRFCSVRFCEAAIEIDWHVVCCSAASGTSQTWGQTWLGRVCKWH